MKKYTATILIADGNPDSMGHALDSELVTWPEGGIPVRRGMDDDAPVIGHAHLTLDGFAIVANVELDEDKLDDLEDDQIDALVPAVAGMGTPDEFDMELQYVALGNWTNADERITSLVPPPVCIADDNGDCSVCGDIIADETSPCSGPPMTVAEIGQALADATKPLVEAQEVLSIAIDADGIVDEDAKVLDFPIPADQDDAAPVGRWRPIADDESLHACTTCGCLWRRNHDESWSLFRDAESSPCCDNVPMTLERVDEEGRPLSAEEE